MGKREFVSLNQPATIALEEEKELESKGYVVISSYGDDVDMGIILEDATGIDKEEVINRHKKYMEYVEKHKKFMKEVLGK